MSGAGPQWDGNAMALAALDYVEGMTPLFDALDGAVAAMVARGWDTREAQLVVAWHYADQTRRLMQAGKL